MDGSSSVPMAMSPPGLCLLDAHANVLGKAVSALAVHDAKVDGLGAGTQAGRDILRPDVVDLGCGAAVDVGTGEERLLHVCVAGDMGQDAQFDLAVIGIHQHAAGLCHKVGAELAAHLGADGDIHRSCRCALIQNTIRFLFHFRIPWYSWHAKRLDGDR